MMNKFCKTLLVLVALGCLSACSQGLPKDALKLSPESLELRQMQTRKFETLNETELLSAAVGVIQDLGYTIDESETKLGVVVASKNTDATETGQVTLAVLGALFGAKDVRYDKDQKIRVSVVTNPSGPTSTNLRATFQRVVWDQKGAVSSRATLNDPEIYQEFFSRLSKAVFLEAHQI